MPERPESKGEPAGVVVARRMSATHQGAGGADVPLQGGPAGEGGAPANGDRDSVDGVIERLLSVRGESQGAFGFLFGAM